MSDQIQFNEQDFKNPLWGKVEKYLKWRLYELRRSNDAISSDMTQTSITRGKIAEVKRMLGLPKRGPAQGDDYSDSE